MVTRCFVFSTGAEDSDKIEVIKCLQSTKSSSHVLPQILKRRNHPILQMWKGGQVKYKSSDSRSLKFSFLCNSISIVTPYNIPERVLSINEPSHFTEAKTDLRDTH